MAPNVAVRLSTLSSDGFDRHDDAAEHGEQQDEGGHADDRQRHGRRAVTASLVSTNRAVGPVTSGRMTDVELAYGPDHGLALRRDGLRRRDDREPRRARSGEPLRA